MKKKKYIERLQKKPSYPNYILHHWADYVEILCIANIDAELSVQDIIDRLSERESDLKEGAEEDVAEMESLDIELDGATRRSEIDEKWHLRVADWFTLLKSRAMLYGEAYPFRVSDNCISFHQDELTDSQLLYCYLLYCSNLYLFPKSIQQLLGSTFELLSLEVVKRKLPETAEVHLFGKNQYNVTGPFRSQTTLLKRIKTLARKLNESVDREVDATSYPASNSGDDGLDIAAWIPVGDGQPSLTVFLCQCACTDAWVSKQSDSSFESWYGKIKFTNHTNNIVLIPFCYRKSNGSWFKKASIRSSLVIDRSRIFNILKGHFSLGTTFPAVPTLKKILKIKESIV